MVEEIRIRSADSDDADRIFELLCQFAWSSTPNRDSFEQNYPKILADSASWLRVAEFGGHVVGYSLAVFQWTLYANGPIVVLQELMVDPQIRKQGIGHALVEQLIHEARTSWACEVTVATRRAKDYYPQFGFTEIAGYFKLKL